MEIPAANLKKQYESIKEEIDNAIKNVLEKGQFILGEEVYKFESEIARFCNVKYAIGVNSGTDALYLSLLSIDLVPGDEVISTDFSFIATVTPVCLLGAKPVLIDIDERTFNIDVNKLAEKITRKTKAIIPVHLFGQPAEMDEIVKLAKPKNIRVIEDAAQAIGAEYKGKKAAGIGDIGILSFYPTKNLGAYGDAGMILTNDEKIAQKARFLRDHGSIKKYQHSLIGINSRLDEIQSAILNVKIKYLEMWTERRRENAKKYNELLKDTSIYGDERTIITPIELPYVKHVYNQYTIRVKQRDKVHDELKKAGISAGVHYPIPIHLQTALSNLEYKKGDFPLSELASKEVLSLPIHPELTDDEIEKIASTIKRIV